MADTQTHPTVDEVARKEAFLDAHIERYVLPRIADVADAPIAAAYFKTAGHAHRIRFLETYAYIRQNLDLSGCRIAETGHLSDVTRYLRGLGIDVEELGGDFRYSIDAPSDAFDVLFSFEVFEHIKDQDSDKLDDIVLFNFSGIQRFASEMFRVTRPGGKLVLTTPNACSLHNMSELANNRPPWLFWPHVKEYTPNQVVDIMTRAGFGLRKLDTFFASFLLQDNEPFMRRFLDATGSSREHRGDCAAFIFEKPN